MVEDDLAFSAALKTEYTAPRKAKIFQLPSLHYLAITGVGAPGGDAFVDAVGALYGIAYTIKMGRRAANLLCYSIGKLETQWLNFEAGPPTDRAIWQWRMMIRTPSFVTPAECNTAAALQLKRGKSARVKDVAPFTTEAGAVIQALHVGPYESEGNMFAVMTKVAAVAGLIFAGPPHDIYLSDPRRGAPEKMRTLLRRAVRSR